MRCFCYAILLTALFFGFAFDARALAYETHRWAMGEWPNRVGLIGISDGAGRVYTTICLGNEVPDDSFGWSFTVRLHIYAVTAIASLPLVLAAAIIIFIRRRRYAQAAYYALLLFAALALIPLLLIAAALVLPPLQNAESSRIEGLQGKFRRELEGYRHAHGQYPDSLQAAPNKRSSGDGEEPVLFAIECQELAAPGYERSAASASGRNSRQRNQDEDYTHRFDCASLASVR